MWRASAYYMQDYLALPTFASRWMCFIDGENLTMRGQAVAESHSIQLTEGAWFSRDAFLWFPSMTPVSVIFHERQMSTYSLPIRSSYYTTACGDESRQRSVKEALRAAGFHAEVFKRSKTSGKSKGMDITLARDILAHGFRDNYDLMVLFAGDGDYVPLVEEIKRLGKIVFVAFFEREGMNSDLKLASDFFVPIDDALIDSWNFFAHKLIPNTRKFRPGSKSDQPDVSSSRRRRALTSFGGKDQAIFR